MMRCAVKAGFVVALACLSTSGLAARVSYTGETAEATGTVAPINLGRQFAVTGSGITVYDLGFFDYLGRPLDTSHAVTFFSLNHLGKNVAASVIPGGSVKVPAGSAASLDHSFRFQPLPQPLYLPPGDYGLIGYGFYPSDHRDPYGYPGGGIPAPGQNIVPDSFDPYRFTTTEQSPVYPGVGDTINHSSVSFHFDLGDTILPGDANFDGSVGFDDLLILAQHYGRAGTYSQGDFNADGSVGFDDLLVLAQHYGTRRQLADLANPSPAPEPAAAALLPVAACALRRRRRSGDGCNSCSWRYCSSPSPLGRGLG